MKNAELLTQWENAVNRVATSWKAKSSSRICIWVNLFEKNAVPTQQLTSANYITSELDGLDKPALKRRCLEESQSPMQIVMHDQSHAKSEASEPSQIPETLSNPKSATTVQSSHVPQSSQVPPFPEKQNKMNYAQLKKKISTLKQKLRRRDKKAINANHLIKTMKKKLLIKEDEAKVLHHNFKGLNLQLFNNSMKNNKVHSCGRRYNDQIREFAVTVQFYSPMAYNHLREIIPLPAPSLIKSWARSIKCSPGFITEVFKILEEEVKGHPEKKDCCLVFHAMATRKQTLWDPTKDAYVGFVNYGDVLPELSDILASEALVFVLVGLRSHWKCPIAYFLIDKISATNQAQLLLKALVLTTEIGLKVWCLTSDGTSSNLSTFRLLGCLLSLTYESITAKFKHPTLDHDVFCVLDPCHMLKLARNTLADLGSMVYVDENGESNEICWKFLQHLHDVQENYGMKLANKLTSNHIKYQSHKMKVDLAAQTLSSSVADAIDFPNIVEKDARFQNSEATVNFIRTIDKLFDILHTRNPLGKGSKQPLKLPNQAEWETELVMIAKILAIIEVR